MTDTTAAPAPAPADTAPATETNTPAPTGAAAVLAGVTPAPAAAPAPADPYGWLPEKHRVKGEDGAINVEASAQKLAEAYRHAEKRIGSGDIPPKDPDGYKITVPEALAESVKVEELEKSADFRAFKASMHAAGLTQSQMDAVTAEMLQASKRTAEMVMQQGPSLEKSSAELRTTWQSPAEFDKNMRMIDQAWAGFADANDREALAEALKIPAVARILAKVGAEMQEDQPIAAGTPEARSWEDQVANLRADPAYTDKTHPKHATIVQQVADMYSKRYSGGKRSLGFAATR